MEVLWNLWKRNQFLIIRVKLWNASIVTVPEKYMKQTISEYWISEVTRDHARYVTDPGIKGYNMKRYSDAEIDVLHGAAISYANKYTIRGAETSITISNLIIIELLKRLLEK